MSNLKTRNKPTQQELSAKLDREFFKLVEALNSLDVNLKIDMNYDIKILPYNERYFLNELLRSISYHLKFSESNPETQKRYSTFDETLTTFCKKYEKQIISASNQTQTDESNSNLYNYVHLLEHITQYLDIATGKEIKDGYKSLDESLSSFFRKCGKQFIAISNDNQPSPDKSSLSNIPEISVKKDTKDSKDLKELLKDIRELKSGHDRLIKHAEENQKYIKQIQDSLKLILNTDFFNKQISLVRELTQKLNNDLENVHFQVENIQANTLRNDGQLTTVINSVNEINARIDGKIDLADAHRVLEYRSMLEAHIEASVIANVSKQILLPLASLKHALNERQSSAIDGAMASLEERCKKAGLSIE